MPTLIDRIAIISAKLTKASIRLLKLGNGSSLPGRVALTISPKVLRALYQELDSTNSLQACITGTNGKTTTTGILKSIINTKLGDKNHVICNDMGANLYYGIVSAFIERSSLAGNLKAKHCVLEADEAAFKQITQDIKPQVITVTNLFRDQLDRFGELNTTKKLIEAGIDAAARNSVGTSNPDLTQGINRSQAINTEDITAIKHRKLILVLNADNPMVASIKEQNTEFKKIFYSVNIKDEQERITNLENKLQEKNIQADISADIINSSVDSSTITLKIASHLTPTSTKTETNSEIKIPLPGIYNIYNAVAAAATAISLGINLESIKTGIENYQTNFGRSEEKEINGVKCKTFLIKNPTGATEVLKLVSKATDANLLIAINDNYADGRDVSWLWDADFEQLIKNKSQIFLSGSRAFDMATRLKYAGLPTNNLQVIPEIKSALKQACKASLSKANTKLLILPTYTALLELEKLS